MDSVEAFRRETPLQGLSSAAFFLASPSPSVLFLSYEAFVIVLVANVAIVDSLELTSIS